MLCFIALINPQKTRKFSTGDLTVPLQECTISARCDGGMSFVKISRVFLLYSRADRDS